MFPRDASVNELNKEAREFISVTMSMFLNVIFQWKIMACWPLISDVLIWVSVWGVNIAPRNPDQVVHGGIIFKTNHPKSPEMIDMDHL